MKTEGIPASIFSSHAGRAGEGGGRSALADHFRPISNYSAAASSPFTVTAMWAVTSRCSLTGTWNSPVDLSGSSSWTLRRSMLKPLAASSWAMSAGGDGAEEVVVFAHFAGEGEGDGVELGDELLGLGLFFGGAAHGGGLHLLDDGLVGRGGLHGEVFGQQKVAAIAVGDLHDVAAVAEVRDIFSEDDFHCNLLRRLEVSRAIKTVSKKAVS